MADTMLSRGPDGFGYFNAQGLGLAHRRLAIIDLSESAAQPMRLPELGLSIVFNGEIYNYRDLRRELEQLGEHFVSAGDTEVLLVGYKAWGLFGLLQKIRGMFAFALFDEPKQELHVVRDPLGKKPLFFRCDQQAFVFASTLPALLAYGKRHGWPLCLSPQALDDYLWNLFIPEGRTIIAGVKQLLPGQYMTIGTAGTTSVGRYWQPDFVHCFTGQSKRQWLERVEYELDCAVRRRLIADVPLGLLLSGGVDSSIITAMAARARPGLKTFSVASQGQHDESQYARAVAEHCRTDHHVLRVNQDIRHGLGQVIENLGQPMADPSLLNFYSIAQIARQHVTVVLTGDGGDEAFGGYGHLFAYHAADVFHSYMPTLVSRQLSRVHGFLQHLPRPFQRAGTLLRLAGNPVHQTYPKPGWISDSLRQSLLTRIAKEQLQDHAPWAHFSRALPADADGPMVQQVMQAHMQTTLPYDYLAKVDYASMAVSLEARCPFLDVDLIDTVAKIPPAIRFHGFTPKSLLRTLARQYVPAHCIDRPKRGFVLPLAAWLATSWSDIVHACIHEGQSMLWQFVDRGRAMKLAQQQVHTGRNSYTVWALVLMELWLRTHIHNEGHALQKLYRGKGN
jgi:asparagine synthase (glutamine-hydrolysing)